ncbi:MAG TPA: hypothetical protein VFL80_04390 [Thermoanaerobaculia bacterium]|nr:hypothetical protein [Thermoanaerobaculia bacterium]
MAAMLAMLLALTACGMTDRQKTTLLQHVSNSVLRAATAGTPSTVSERTSEAAVNARLAQTPGGIRSAQTTSVRVRSNPPDGEKRLCRKAKRVFAIRAHRENVCTTAYVFVLNPAQRVEGSSVPTGLLRPCAERTL